MLCCCCWFRWQKLGKDVSSCGGVSGMERGGESAGERVTKLTRRNGGDCGALLHGVLVVLRGEGVAAGVEGSWTAVVYTWFMAVEHLLA